MTTSQSPGADSVAPLSAFEKYVLLSGINLARLHHDDKLVDALDALWRKLTPDEKAKGRQISPYLDTCNFEMQDSHDELIAALSHTRDSGQGAAVAWITSRCASDLRSWTDWQGARYVGLSVDANRERDIVYTVPLFLHPPATSGHAEVTDAMIAAAMERMREDAVDLGALNYRTVRNAIEAALQSAQEIGERD